MSASITSSIGYRRYTDPNTGHPQEVKHLIHPELGALELNCEQLIDPGQAHSLLVRTAVPGSENYQKLQLLSVIGSQPLR